MFNGFKIEKRDQLRRMKYQERQRLQQAEVKQALGTQQTKGKLDKFAIRLIK